MTSFIFPKIVDFDRLLITESKKQALEANQLFYVHWHRICKRFGVLHRRKRKKHYSVLIWVEQSEDFADLQRRKRKKHYSVLIWAEPSQALETTGE